MKMINAIIRPEQLPDVKKALEEKGFFGLTVTEAMGCGAQKGMCVKTGNTITRVDLLPKAELMVVVPDAKEKLALETIINSARTGRMGDGRIFVCHVDKSVRVRTGEEEK